MAVKFNYLIPLLLVIIAIGDSISGQNDSRDVENFIQDMKQFTCTSNNFVCELAVQPPQTINIDEDAKALYEAIQIKAIDKLIQIICSRSLVQRLAIATKFKDNYKANLVDKLNGLGSVGLEKFSLALFSPPWQYFATDLYNAMTGWGTSEDDLIEILVPLSNKAVRSVSNYYKQQYGGSLAQDIEGDTSGYFRSLLLLLSDGARNQSNQDNKAAIEIAQTFYKDQNEVTFNSILATASFPDLRKSFVEFKNISGKDIEDVITNTNFGDNELIKTYLDIVKFAKDPFEYSANVMEKILKYHRSLDAPKKIVRLLVGHSDIDLGNIKATYKNIYGISLADKIQKIYKKSDFKKILLALVGP